MIADCLNTLIDQQHGAAFAAFWRDRDGLAQDQRQIFDRRIKEAFGEDFLALWRDSGRRHQGRN